MNMGIHYLGENLGREAVREYLTRFTERVYGAELLKAGREGNGALVEFIKQTYVKERAEELVSFSENDGVLTVKVSECPAVKHLVATGREVSPWFLYTTTVPMERFAEELKKRFELVFYNAETGEAEYKFV
jgi:hypothetical protein